MNIIESLIPYGGGIQIPDTIIVHSMAENLLLKNGTKHAVAYLNDIKLSAHVLVAPNGDIYRCHPDNEIAWHAIEFNTNSLGIEFLVEGDYIYETFLDRIKETYITSKQLVSGLEIINNWFKIHNIKKIVRHSDISPERKVDPGLGFPWDYLLDNIREF